MSRTYEPITTYTLPSNGGPVTFSSIPQTYTDLRVVIKGGVASGGFFIGFRIGTGSVDANQNYSNVIVKEETGALSTRSSNKTLGAFYEQSGPNNLQQSIVCDFLNYSNTTTYKTYLSRAGDATGYTSWLAGAWRNTGAIDVISIALCGMGGTGFFNYANMYAGSTFTLYGIKAE